MKVIQEVFDSLIVFRVFSFQLFGRFKTNAVTDYEVSEKHVSYTWFLNCRFAKFNCTEIISVFVCEKLLMTFWIFQISCMYSSTRNLKWISRGEPTREPGIVFLRTVNCYLATQRKREERDVFLNQKQAFHIGIYGLLKY